MKPTHFAAALIGGAVAAALGYATGLQVGFTGGIRAASDVMGYDAKEVAHRIKRKQSNPRMGN